MFREGFTTADKKKLNEEMLERYQEKLELFESKVEYYKNLIKEKMLDGKDISKEEAESEKAKAEKAKAEKAESEKAESEKAEAESGKAKAESEESNTKKNDNDSDSDDSDDDDVKNPNLEGFSNFSFKKREGFYNPTSASGKWKLPRSGRFYLNLGLRSLLYACLFYILIHYETRYYMTKVLKLSEDNSQYVLMIIFFVFYFVLNIFL